MIRIALLVILTHSLLTVTAVPVLAVDITLVDQGHIKEARFVGQPWKSNAGGLIGRGDQSRLISEHELTNDSFHIRAKLTLPKLDHRAPEIGIGRFSYFQFDANGGRFIIGGPLFVPDDQMIRYTIIGRNANLIRAGQPFLFEAIGESGQIEFRIDGKSIHRHKLLRQHIGPVSLFPNTTEIQVSEFSITSTALSSYDPENLNSHGVVLDSRLTWKPELVKAHYTKLQDGSLAYLNGNQLRVSNDLGKTWESQEGNILFDGYGKEFAFSGAMLLQTHDGTLVAVTINAKNYVHLDWDEKTQRATGGTREVWALRSKDNGKTWCNVQKIYGGYCGALVDMIETSQGHIVVPVQELSADGNRHVTRTYVSSDAAQTWKKGNVLDIGGSGNHSGNFEPTLAELADGKILMLMRTNLDYLWAAYSDDGLYWRETRPSQFDASSSPAYLKRLASGRLILIWNRVYPEGKDSYRRRIGKWSETPVSWCREEVSMAISDTTGQNWSKPIVVARKPGIWMAYPYLFEPNPGTLWMFASGGLRVEFHEADFVEKLSKQ